jgi:hypothetical protein
LRSSTAPAEATGRHGHASRSSLRWTWSNCCARPSSSHMRATSRARGCPSASPGPLRTALPSRGSRALPARLGRARRHGTPCRAGSRARARGTLRGPASRVGLTNAPRPPTGPCAVRGGSGGRRESFRGQAHRVRRPRAERRVGERIPTARRSMGGVFTLDSDRISAMQAFPSCHERPYRWPATPLRATRLGSRRRCGTRRIVVWQRVDRADPGPSLGGFECGWPA